MREHEPELKKRGAGVAAIGLADRRYAKLFREATKIDFPVLIDEERTAYKAAGLLSANVLHLLRADNAKARARAQAAGHQQHSLGKNPFQLGGSFVFAPGDVDVFAYLSKTFGDNAPVPDLVAAVDGYSTKRSQSH